MTTEGIERQSGSGDDGTPWSAVVKRLRPASASADFEGSPKELRAADLVDVDWLDEPRVYRCGLGDELPGGFRMPELRRVDEEPDRITLWLEDVPDEMAWSPDRYRRTARSLGA